MDSLNNQTVISYLPYVGHSTPQPWSAGTLGVLCSRKWTYLVIVVIACSSVLFRGSTHGSHAFRRADGTRMTMLKSDTRFRRFTEGPKLSAEGHAQAQGAPFAIRNGSRTEVVLSTPKHMQDFYSGDARDHAKPPHMNMGHYFDRVLGQSVGVQSGSKWRTTRAHFDPSFSYLSATNFQDRFASEIARWLTDLQGDADVVSRTADDFSVDAVQACHVLPFKLIACACYGDMLDEVAFAALLQLNDAHEKLMLTTFFGWCTTSRLYNLLPFAETRAMNAYQKHWTSFNDRVITKAREAGINCPVEKIYSAVESGTITKTEYLQAIDEILFTNVDVTSAVLGFLLINLAANQGCQSDLRAEMVAALSTEGSADEMDVSLLKRYHAAPGTLLEYTCMESIRLCPAAWFSLPEYSPNDKIIDGFYVPAKVPVIIDWKRLNTESPVWSPQPGEGQPRIDGHTFEPRRFTSLKENEYRYSLLRFGIGPRKCIGKNFAGVVMKLFLTMILPRFELQLERSGETEKGYTYREDRFTVTPKQVVRFVAR